MSAGTLEITSSASSAGTTQNSAEEGSRVHKSDRLFFIFFTSFFFRFPNHDLLQEQPSCQAQINTAKIFTIIFALYFNEKGILFSRALRLHFTSARRNKSGCY